LEKVSTTSYDGVNFEFLTDPNGNWDIVGSQGDPLNWYTDIVNSLGFGIPGWGGTSPTGATNWTLIAHSLPASFSGLPFVQFRFFLGSDNTNQFEGFEFDDFSLTVPTTIPLCPVLVSPASSVVVNSTFVTFTWQRNSSQVSRLFPGGYRVYLDTVNPPVNFFDVGVVTSYTSVVSPNTAFFWSVVAYGYGGTLAANCEIRTFESPFEPTLYLPYFENFEAGDGNWIPTGTLSTWAFGTPAKNTIKDAHSGVNAWVTGGLTLGLYNNL
jgi:hypothetical protein